jgi:hypothetical protein
MLKKIPLLPTCLCCFLLVACSKEKSIDSTDPGHNGGGTNVSNELIGDWKFVQMHVVAESVVDAIGGGIPPTKTITETDYYTKDNTGTMTFTANKIDYSNFGYSVDTVVKAEIIIDGISMGEMEQAFSFAMPPVSGSSSYKIIGADSLYSPAGFINMAGLGQMPTQGAGSRFRIVNDTLILTTPINYNLSREEQGTNITTHHVGTGTTTLVRL